MCDTRKKKLTLIKIIDLGSNFFDLDCIIYGKGFFLVFFCISRRFFQRYHAYTTKQLLKDRCENTIIKDAALMKFTLSSVYLCFILNNFIY
jgi:hypothetical protein